MAIEDLLDAAKVHSRLAADSQLAAHVGCTKAAVARWRKGPVVPSDQYAAALARLTGYPEKYVLECLQVARQNLREFGSWNSPLTRRMLSVIQRLEPSDRVALTLALDACAEAFEDIRLQCANVKWTPLQILRSGWVRGYVYGYTETAVRSCGGDGYWDSGIDAFVEMTLTRLSGDRKRAEYWMTLTHFEPLADDDYSAGKQRGAQERSRVAVERPTGISDYFNRPASRKDARDAGQEARTDVDAGCDDSNGMRDGTRLGANQGLR